jgi:DUF2946 family protein
VRENRNVTASSIQLFRRTFDRFALLLGFIALAVQAMAPLCLSGLMDAHSAGGSSIILCTAHGFQTIRLDSDGNPLPNAPAKNGSDSVCPLCTGFQAASAFAVPAPIVLALALSFTRERPMIATVPAVSARPYLSYITRGPPPAVRDGFPLPLRFGV